MTLEEYMRNTGDLIIVRGLPGSGKSTLAKLIGGEHIETDMFFLKNGEYKFDATKLKEAHNWCQLRCRLSMAAKAPKIVVSNTFTQEWEMEEYLKLAETFKYNVHTIVVENRHGGKNVHNVPEETLVKMKERFSIKIS